MNTKKEINPFYYKQLSRFEQLSNEEIKNLYLEINDGNQSAIDKLIKANLKLVIHFAKQYKGLLRKVDTLEFDDLISEGNIGLIKAIKNYNPELNIRFSYYAGFWIKKSINECVINFGYTIKSPAYKLASDSKISKLVNILYQKNQYDIFPEDIEELNQFTEEQINHYFFSKPNCVPIENENEINIMNDEESNREEDKHKIQVYFQYLNERENNILKLYYGIESEKSMTLKQIGEIYSLSNERIKQIRDKTFEKIKSKLN